MGIIGPPSRDSDAGLGRLYSLKAILPSSGGFFLSVTITDQETGTWDFWSSRPAGGDLRYLDPWTVGMAGGEEGGSTG